MVLLKLKVLVQFVLENSIESFWSGNVSAKKVQVSESQGISKLKIILFWQDFDSLNRWMWVFKGFRNVLILKVLGLIR